VFITRQQMRSLDERAFDGFVARLVPFVRRRCGSVGAFAPACVPVDDARLASQVRACALRARAHGLASERALAGFVVLAFSCSPDFDSEPRVRAILEDTRLAPDARMRGVFDAIARAEARRQLHAGSRP
jgi:hypothetical protein